MLVVDYTHSVRILLQTVGQLGKMVQHYRTALVHILLLGQTIQIISMYLVMLVFNIGPYQLVEHIRLKCGVPKVLTQEVTVPEMEVGE